MARRSSQCQARRRPQQWWQGLAWLTSVAVALICVFSFVGLMTYTAIGQHAVQTLRFALGWYHIAWQQQQLSQAIEVGLSTLGLSPNVYRQEDIVLQRRGGEQ